MASDRARLYHLPDAAEADSEVIAALRTASKRRFSRGDWKLPVRAWVSSPFGVERFRNGVPAGRHQGVDLAAPHGEPVEAPGTARVILAKWLQKYGGTVVLDHGRGITSFYSHLSSIEARRGQRVKPGDRIGRVGDTGAATGPHLHWGVYLKGEAVNPLRYLAKSERLGPTAVSPTLAGTEPRASSKEPRGARSARRAELLRALAGRAEWLRSRPQALIAAVVRRRRSRAAQAAARPAPAGAADQQPRQRLARRPSRTGRGTG